MIPTCKLHVKWIMFKFSLRSGNDCVKLINHLSTDRPIMDCDTLKSSVDTYSFVMTHKKLTSLATTIRGWPRGTEHPCKVAIFRGGSTLYHANVSIPEKGG